MGKFALTDEQMCEMLDISRSTLWNNLLELREEGFIDWKTQIGKRREIKLVFKDKMGFEEALRKMGQRDMEDKKEQLSGESQS